jgi:hypothetical protein
MKDEMMKGMPGFEVEIAQAEQDDEMAFEEMAPTGNFSAKSLNNLVKAANRLLPLFDQTADYPQFTNNEQRLPTDFVRVLAMFEGAIQDAIDKDMLDEEMGFAIEEITNDPMLNMVAGKISSVASSKDFRRYLKEMPDEMGEEMAQNDEEETEDLEDEPNTRNIDALFLERL